MTAMGAPAADAGVGKDGEGGKAGALASSCKEEEELERMTFRSVSWRILPIFCLYTFVGSMEKSNLSYASRCVIIRSLTHSLTHSLAHSLTHSLSQRAHGEHGHRR